MSQSGNQSQCAINNAIYIPASSVIQQSSIYSDIYREVAEFNAKSQREEAARIAALPPQERFEEVIRKEMSIPHSGGYYNCENRTDMICEAGQIFLDNPEEVDIATPIKYSVDRLDYYYRVCDTDQHATTYIDCIITQYQRYFQGHPVFCGDEGMKEKARFDVILLKLAEHPKFIELLRASKRYDAFETVRKMPFEVISKFAV